MAQQHALEHERVRIAQDLHDDLGAGLAQISFASAMAQNPAMAPEAGRELLGEVGGRARELVTALDEIVWAVNPKNDSVLSLSSYCCLFAQSFLKNTPMSCRLELAADLPATPLSSEQRHHLFLAVKQAVHNAVQHSGGSVLTLSISVQDGALCIAVADNGGGIPPGPPPPSADGLAGMSRRLANLGGQCEIARAPAGGTRVLFRLPLARPIVNRENTP
jgi:signal transduction histidine kinase